MALIGVGVVAYRKLSLPPLPAPQPVTRVVVGSREYDPATYETYPCRLVGGRGEAPTAEECHRRPAG